ncbi:MAG: peptidoglycan-binding protein [Rhodobacteraceae bacterium]|nr:peptidoglycan-binding protein [Paracoccaceae bacterium]
MPRLRATSWFCVLWLAAASPVLAEELAGPADIAPAGALFPCQRSGASEAFWSCLAAAGVPSGGIDFARRLAADPALGGPGLLIDFTELGAVDLAEVLFPFLANTNQQTLLVNGAAGVVQPLAIEPQRPDDPQTQAILAAHPDAFPSLRVSVEGYRAEGTWQRFVLTDPVTDSCRACPVVAAALTVADFDDGALARVDPLGWIPLELAADETRAAALRQGDVRALQVALALRGYDPGPLDGARGPATETALGDFQRDNCLAASTAVTPAALTVLTASGPYLTAPACGPSRSGAIE